MIANTSTIGHIEIELDHSSTYASHIEAKQLNLRRGLVRPSHAKSKGWPNLPCFQVTVTTNNSTTEPQTCIHSPISCKTRRVA